MGNLFVVGVIGFLLILDYWVGIYLSDFIVNYWMELKLFKNFYRVMDSFFFLLV